MKIIQSLQRVLTGMLLLTGTLVVSAFLLISCSDDDGASKVPTISSFSPQSGLIGTEVTIQGTDLNRVTKVEFGSIVATVVSKSKDQMKVTVPAGASTAKIKLKFAEGHVTTPEDFTVTYRPYGFPILKRKTQKRFGENPKTLKK